MQTKINLKAQKRTLFGKKIKSLRREGLVPANIFGSKIESLAITVSLLDFKKVYKQAGETSVINLSIEGEKDTRPVLLTKTQVDPVKKKLLHVDFRQVDLAQKIVTNIPLEIIGESPAVAKGLVLLTLRDEVEVEALPTNLPEKLTLNVSNLKEISDTLTVANLVVDQSKVTIKLNPEELLVQLQEPKEEVVITPKTETSTDTTESKEKSEDNKPEEPKKETDKK